MGAIPLVPLHAAFQKASTPVPMGETTPSPVITALSFFMNPVQWINLDGEM
jgi:hypothetical protein